jgi:hypothetical protein
VRSVEGAINGELSPGTYKDFMAAAVRRAYAAVTAISGALDHHRGTGPTYTVARAAGSWLTDGIKVGQVGRLTAGSFNAANLNKNLVVTAVTALNLTVMPLNGVALVAEGPIASATWTPTGKVTYAPSTATPTSRTRSSTGTPTSRSRRCSRLQDQPHGARRAAAGHGTIGFDFLGKDITTAGAEYFTSPTAETTTGIAAAANGILLAQGASIATLTGLELTLDGNMSAEDVIGSTTYQDIAEGRILVSGTDDRPLRLGDAARLFLNETEVSIVAFLPVSPAATADFVAVTLPRVKAAAPTSTTATSRSSARCPSPRSTTRRRRRHQLGADHHRPAGQPGMKLQGRCSSRARRGGRGARARRPGHRRAHRLEDPPARLGRAVAAGAAARAAAPAPRAARAQGDDRVDPSMFDEEASRCWSPPPRLGRRRARGRRAVRLHAGQRARGLRREARIREQVAAFIAAAQIFRLGPRAPRSVRGAPVPPCARTPDGLTERDHLEAAAKRGDKRAQAELAGPACPAGAEYLWGWFRALDAARGASGFGLNPISSPSSRPSPAAGHRRSRRSRSTCCARSTASAWSSAARRSAHESSCRSTSGRTSSASSPSSTPPRATRCRRRPTARSTARSTRR